jgi:putative flippase GtrA
MTWKYFQPERIAFVPMVGHAVFQYFILHQFTFSAMAVAEPHSPVWNGVRNRSPLLRYAIVGVTSNAILYVLYLLLTVLGVTPEIAMSLLFTLGIAQTFAFNRNWSFAYQGSPSRSFFRYAIVYLLAYVVNLSALEALVIRYGYPHQAVQAIMIILLAVSIFVAQRYWVFRNPRAPEKR